MLSRAVAYGLDLQFPAQDSAIGDSLMRYGEFARCIADFLIDHAVEETGVLIDAGANIGSIGLPFAKARPGWQVKAIEAHGGLAHVLTVNAARNLLSNVFVVRAAAGGTSGEVDFPNPPLIGEQNYGTLSIARAGEFPTVRTPMVTLDEIAPPDTRLVKMDLEGHDPEALRGAPRLLHEIRPVWLIEAAINHPQATGAVIQTMLLAGYSVYWFYAPFVSLEARRARGEEVGGAESWKPLTLGDANIVALPPGTPNAWRLPEVKSATDKRPGFTAAYPYLQRYGFQDAAAG
ncbi:FkbM family methyltransferase [Phenylobacterium sp.]|uniref:FkbM family methyltransferase n=1 Tax=Phenylobacterium sp. TaxID=1871053 RepID=UPI0025DEDCD5|nr:FkbM family methyltransferase [Phenylobacterium sp.]MBX3484014.1 FkbM family methyltransferase [Phenylobacterium sp.]